VFLHVLASGTAAQVRWLRDRFGDRAIRAWVRKGRGWGIAADRLSSWVAPDDLRGWWRHDPASRTWTERRLLTAADAPASVRRLLKSYEPQALLWGHPGNRYIVVSEILARGDDEARAWLWDTMDRRQVIEMVRERRGAGLAEPVRARLREELGLTTDDLPVRPYLGIS
jgi:hypothetical protein